MAKLTLTIDTIMYHGLEQYIESLEGLSKVLITNKTNLIITITYDDSKIDINTFNKFNIIFKSIYSIIISCCFTISFFIKY